MFARTQRLLLRPGWLEDAPALAAAIASENIAFSLARLPWPYTLADARAWLSRERGMTDPQMLICERTDGAPRLVGGIGLHDDGRDMELGYWIAPSRWGLGFATEAGRAVIDLARNSLRLDRLVAGHFLDNPASGRVLRKLGFRPTGKIEMRQCLAHGEARPCAVHVLDFEPMALAA